MNLGLLRGREIAGVAILLDGRLGRVVLVVILGVDLEASSVGHGCESATKRRSAVSVVGYRRETRRSGRRLEKVRSKYIGSRVDPLFTQGG